MTGDRLRGPLSKVESFVIGIFIITIVCASIGSKFRVGLDLVRFKVFG